MAEGYVMYVTKATVPSSVVNRAAAQRRWRRGTGHARENQQIPGCDPQSVIITRERQDMSVSTVQRETGVYGETSVQSVGQV